MPKNGAKYLTDCFNTLLKSEFTETKIWKDLFRLKGGKINAFQNSKHKFYKKTARDLKKICMTKALTLTKMILFTKKEFSKKNFY